MRIELEKILKEYDDLDSVSKVGKGLLNDLDDLRNRMAMFAITKFLRKMGFNKKDNNVYTLPDTTSNGYGFTVRTMHSYMVTKLEWIDGLAKDHLGHINMFGINMDELTTEEERCGGINMMNAEQLKGLVRLLQRHFFELMYIKFIDDLELEKGKKFLSHVKDPKNTIQLFLSRKVADHFEKNICQFPLFTDMKQWKDKDEFELMSIYGDDAGLEIWKSIQMMKVELRK